MSKTKRKELKTLLQKYFGISDPKPTKIKKPIHEKDDSPREKLSSLMEEIGKDVFGIQIKVEWGKCPHCESITQLLSLYSNYYKCTLCHETIKQHVNGHIAYLPIEHTSTLDDGQKES